MSWSVRKILVPTDFSDLSFQVISYALAFANKVHAELIILHIGDSANEARNKILMSSLIEKVRSENYIGRSVRVRTKLAHGPVPEAIRKQAIKTGAHLIIMGTSGEAGIMQISKYLQGTYTYQVVGKAPCPVISMAEVPKPISFKEILLPLDLTKQTTQKVYKAVNFARTFDSTIHLLAVSNFLEEIISEVDDLQALLDNVATGIRGEGIRCTTEMIRHDHVTNSVTEYAEEINADLIVIMTRQEKKLDEWFMGTRARKIISASSRPVLSLIPDLM